MSLVSVLLIPFSWLYGGVVWLRNWLFDLNVLSVETVGLPVISVGNLTVGGTGKTPFVEYLVRYCMSKGKLVGILSRGYRRSTRGTFIVSDGKTLFGNNATSGDEPFQLARKFSSTVVVVDEDRVRAARMMEKSFPLDVIILDDGFQHRSLSRDLDILLADHTQMKDMQHMLPCGRRREPMSATRRADIIVLTRSIGRDQNVTFPGNAPVIRSTTRVTGCFSVLDDQQFSDRSLSLRRVIGFCGIGNPGAFTATLQQAGIPILEMVTFPDHHSYTAGDMRELHARFENKNAELIVTTEKDAVRIRPMLHHTTFESHQFLYLTIEMVVGEGEQLLHRRIDSVLERLPS